MAFCRVNPVYALLVRKIPPTPLASDPALGPVTKNSHTHGFSAISVSVLTTGLPPDFALILVSMVSRWSGLNLAGLISVSRIPAADNSPSHSCEKITPGAS